LFALPRLRFLAGARSEVNEADLGYHTLCVTLVVASASRLGEPVVAQVSSVVSRFDSAAGI
jgi:hypothetical protein